MSTELPDSQTSNAVICGQCEASNHSSRKFCGKCGTRLWEICAACQEKTSAAEAFCGCCGANLSDALAGTAEQYQEALVEAERLAMESLFDKALAQIKPVLELEHPRLQDLVERARKQDERLRKEYQQNKDDAEAAMASAKIHWESRDFRRALQALRGVAEPLRSEEMQELLTDVEAFEEDCRALLQQIRAKLAAKATSELLPLVEQYLLLDPAHAEVNKLAEKVRALHQQESITRRDRLCESARRSIEQHAYNSAVEQLNKIPEVARNGIFFKLLEHAEELSYLSGMLRNSPHVDQTLLDIGKRLLKHAPGDKQALERYTKAKQRILDRPDNPRAGAPEWSQPPNRTPFDMPVDWLGGFARIKIKDEDVRKRLAAAPGRFYTAVGLALQGLQKSRVNINLLPEKKKGLLNRIGGSGRSKPPKSAWGLDIGTTAIKAIKLSADEDGRARIDACEVIEYEKELCRPDTRGQEGELIGMAIKEFLQMHRPDPKTEPVAISVPGGRVLGRFLRVPRVKPSKVGELMQYEAAHQIPLPLESLCWGYQLLEASGAEEPMMNCVIMGAQRHDMEQRVAWCQNAGLTVEILQSECMALYNFILAELFDPAAPAVENPETNQIVLMDIGGDSTHILIAGQQSVWFRTLGRGTDEFTRRLIRAFNLTYDVAEPLKKNPAMAKSIHKVQQALAPAMEDIANELRLSLSAFATHQASLEDEDAEAPSHLFGCGGGFQTLGLLQHFRGGS